MVLGAVLLSNNAQAQSVDSVSLIRPHIVAAQAKDSTKEQAKTIRLVSKSTLPLGNNPFIVVDGNVVTEQDIKLITPNDIDKLEILKGATATAIYGSRAANGAVLITLKHSQTKPVHQQPVKKKGCLN